MAAQRPNTILLSLQTFPLVDIRQCVWMQLDWDHELILSWTIQLIFMNTASVTIQNRLSVFYRNPRRDPDKQEKKTLNRKKPRTGQAYFGATLMLMAGWGGGGEIKERIYMVNTPQVYTVRRGDTNENT